MIFATGRSPVAAAVVAGIPLLAVVSWLPVPRVLAASPDDLGRDQEPGNRYYWLERAFCDLPPYGPERAHGLILWNHRISGTTQSWKAPAPPVLRLLQFRGWDVIMLKRHHLAETMAGGPLYRTAQRTLQEATAWRKQGYRKIVLAGQSFGGYVSLEAADSTDDVDAVVALAPGVRNADTSGSLEDGAIQAVLSNNATVTLSPEGDGTITWRSSDGSRSLKAPLVKGRGEP